MAFTTHTQGGGLGAGELLGLPSHQLLHLAGPAPDLTSAGYKYGETQHRTASEMWVWEPKPPELNAVVQACQYVHAVSPLCFRSYAFHGNWKEPPN